MGRLASEKVNSQPRGIFLPRFCSRTPGRDAYGRGKGAAGLTECLLCSHPGLGVVRASSVFPILSTILLLLGGLCIGAGRIYSRKNNIVLSAGILFVAAGMRSCPEAVVERLNAWSWTPGVCILVGGQSEIPLWS